MYSVCGDNDYVNVLGKKVIPKSNTVYIRTKTAATDIFGAHTIVPEYYKDVNKHYCDYLFDFSRNAFNDQVSQQRELARCSQELSRNAMNLPHDKREDMCRTLMTLSEQFIGGSNSPNGLNGEKATLEESVGFLTNLYEIIVPLTSYVGTRQGEDMLFDLLIFPHDANADSSLASAPIGDRLNYVMSDPDLMKLYYLGASLAIESISERAAQVGYAVGEVSSKQLTAELGFVLQNQLSAMDMVNSCLRGTADLVSNAVSAVKSYINTSMNVRASFLRSIGLGSLAGFSNWSKYFEYCNNEGKVLRYGTNGNDNLAFTNADEAIYGGTGDDYLHGKGGNDDIYGEEGADHLFGEEGSDKLFGGAGGDFLSGNQDNDYLHGGFGDDTLKGGAGNDALYGSVGNDTLMGEEGDDLLCGGIGNDTYIFKRGFGSDIVNDSDGEETFRFDDMLSSEMLFTTSDDKSVTIRNMNTGDRVTFRNFKPARYTFVFSGVNYIVAKKNGAYVFREI
jgi:Ca2+-binding RTX toxin-like protein